MKNTSDKKGSDLVNAFQQLQRENEELKEKLKEFEELNQPLGQVAGKRPQGATFFNAKILDFFPQKIFIKDCGSKYITCNKSFADDFEITIEEIAGKTDYDLYSLERANACRETDSQVIESGIPKDSVEEFMIKDTRRWVHIVKAPLFDQQNNITGIVGILEDITELKEAVEELKESREHLAVTLYSIGDGVIATDINGLVVNMNPVAESLCGWRLSEAIGRPLPEVFHIVNAFTRLPAENPVETVLTTGKVVGLANHTVLISNNGQEYQIADSAAPILTADGNITGVVMVFSDVTEKYEKEQALAESEQKLRNIIEHSINTFYSHDVDGNLIYVSPQIKDLIGCEPEEAVGDWTKFLTDNPINKKGEDSTRIAIETGVTQPVYELELKHKNGSSVWVEVSEAPLVENGKVVAIVGSHTDITWRRQSEQQLKESENRYRSLYDQSYDAILVLEGKTIIDCNLAATRMFDCLPDKIIGQSLNRFSPEFQPNGELSEGRSYEILEEAFKGIGQKFEWLHITYDGNPFEAEVATNLVKTGDRNLIRVLIRDISVRKETERKLRESEEFLSVTLNSIGDGMIATDINGLIVNMNQVAESLCGWMLREAIGRPLLEVFHIVNAFTRLPAENPVETVLATGKVVGLANHTVLISKSGQEYQIADSAAPILSPLGEIQGVVMVFSDVSEKYEKAQALAASEQKLRHIIENSTNTFYSHDVEGNIIFFSPQIKNLVGYEVSEAFGNWTRFLSDNPENNFGLELTRKAIETGETQPPYELELFHKDGSRVWVEINEAPVIENGKVVAIVGSNTDITERKEAEAKIRESEERYRNLFDLSMDAILLMENDKIVQCNLAALRMFGSLQEQIKGKSVIDFSPEFQPNKEASARLALEIVKDANAGVPKHFEWVHSRANGSVFDAEVSLNRVKTKKQVFLQAIVRDITAKKKTEQYLRESEEKFRAIVENMGEGLLLTDLDDRVIYANNRIRDIYGYEPMELTGKIGYEILEHPEDWSTLRKKKSVRLKGEADTTELRGITKSGEIIWTKINGAPVCDAAGEVIATVGIIEDITQKKQAELSLRMLSTAIEQSPASVIISNPEGLIEYVNPAFERLTGYGKDEVLGKNPSILKSGNQNPEFYQNMWKTIQSGNIWEGQIQNRKKDGQTFWERATISPVFDQENKIVHYLGIKEDITERKKNEEDRIASLERERQEAEILREIATSQNLSKGLVKELAEEISPKVAQFFGVERFGVWLYNKEKALLENVSNYLISSKTFTWEGSLKESDYQSEFNAFKQSRYVDADDVFTDPRVSGYLEPYLLTKNIKSMLDTVIKIEGEVRGILCFEQVDTPRKWKAEEKAFACQLADQFAIAIMHSEKLKAEAEIKKLSMALEQSPASIVITSLDGSIEYVNPVFTAQTGYQLSEVVGENLGILSQGLNEPEIFNEMWSRVLSGNIWEYEIQTRNKDGRLRWEQVLVSPIVNSGGEITNIADFRIDITERKLAEEKLSERERVFSTLVASLPGMAYRQALDIHWTTHLISHACFHITGYQPEDLVDNKTISYNDLILEEFHQPIWEKWQDVVAGKKVFEYEYQIRRSDGEIRWVWERGQPVYDEKGQVLYLEGYIEDITVRKTAQEEILKTRDRLLQFFEEDISADYISTPDGRLFLCNDTFVKLFGFSSKDEAYNTSIPTLYKNESDRDNFLSALKNNGQVNNYELDFLSKEGKSIHALLNASGDFDKHGNLLQIRGYINDITAQTRTMEQLIQAKEKAEEASKLKTAFLANMSHEIRTPMNGILGFTDLLKEPDLSSDDIQSFISIIQKSGRRLLKTVNDLIDVSKIETGIMDVELSTININDLLEELYKFFKPETDRKGIEFSYSAVLPNEGANLVTDSLKFHGVLSNLLHNAIKFTSEGKIQFGYEKKGEVLQFFVKDSGAGVPPDRLKAIFERFVQADPENRQAYQGAGLGLAIAKSYVEMLGGTIWLESELGKGSVFFINLPASALHLPDVSKMVNPAEKKSPLKDPLRILIADDDEATVSLLKRTLKPMAKEFLVAFNGLEAVALARENPDVKLILMDISMPEIHGYEATRQIREFNKEVIIIAQTAFAMYGDREKALKAGCNGHVSKPIEFEELKKLIEQCIGS